MDIIDHLKRYAKAEQSIAHQYKDCSFMGTHPSVAHTNEANCLLQAAMEIKQLRDENMKLKQLINKLEK